MPNPILIFFSYASEDQKLVDAIIEALDTAFRNSISTKNMKQFELGISYRQEIDDVLDRADILLVVASGKEKLSHTFTGYEVGYFRKSQRTRPLISEEPRLERLIIPLAVLTDLPDTVSEIQGVEISEIKGVDSEVRSNFCTRWSAKRCRASNVSAPDQS